MPDIHILSNHIHGNALEEVGVSVRNAMLAILTQGPCYGYQLRTEFARRTGVQTHVNVGQIYNTLERLERDALVERAGVDDAGHVFWRVTESGRAEVAAWFSSPVARAGAARDELAIKITLAASLQHIDVLEVLRVQEAATATRKAEIDADLAALSQDPAHFARAVMAESERATTIAEQQWLASTTERLLADPTAMHLTLSRERPKRGRPARSAAR